MVIESQKTDETHLIISYQDRFSYIIRPNGRVQGKCGKANILSKNVVFGTENAFAANLGCSEANASCNKEKNIHLTIVVSFCGLFGGNPNFNQLVSANRALCSAQGRLRALPRDEHRTVGRWHT